MAPKKKPNFLISPEGPAADNKIDDLLNLPESKKEPKRRNSIYENESLSASQQLLNPENFEDVELLQRVLFEKTRYQRYALLIKNITLQRRQMLSNILQLMVPILGLSVMIFLREAVVSNSEVFANSDISIPIPFFYNIPLKPFASFGRFFNVTDCNEWYAFSFGKNATQEDKEYFGKNEGYPMNNPNSSGMLKGGKNILEMPCQEIGLSVPYFKDIETLQKDEGTNKSMNQLIYDEILKLTKNNFDLTAKFKPIDGLEVIPDGLIEVNKANNKNFDYRLQINDYSYFQYHRNNGITKIGLVTQNKNKTEGVEFLEDTGNTSYVMRPTEGALQLADRINQAYIRSIFPDTHIISGQQFMPFQPGVRNEAEKIINCIGVLVYPVLLSLSLPMFLYTIVLEKEQRLIQNMKINGLRMLNYWSVNYFFNFSIYTVTMFVYFLFGKFVSRLSFFTDTHPVVILLAFFGWGFCQVSLAFVLSCFLNNSQTATMIGYALSIIMTVVSCTLMVTGGIYEKDMTLLWSLRPIPSFCFGRIMYILVDPCAWNRCLGRLDEMPAEIFELIKILYISAFFYLLLALYLNEVIPQTYGVPKHPLFLLEPYILKISPSAHKLIFGDESDLIAFKDDSELIDEDEDAKNERQYIYNLERKLYCQFPLVVKDIRKVYPSANGRIPKVANKNISLRVNNGELFGLLGPNGAGKTTLIAQLTGLYPSTNGNAWIGGFSVKSQLEVVQLQIGVCPQFDILWDNLTVEEHLLFYARLKGIGPDEEKKMVKLVLKEVQLSSQKDLQTIELPLGMRRRLSIAIALVSSPKIIFLDEPTTGLDPETRRQLWNILQECKKEKNRAMVLTTHSMEEADVLCNRIGIVNNGVLCCLGSQNRLKALYGGGYHLFINCIKQRSGSSSQQTIQKENEIYGKISKFISQCLPHSIQLRQFNGQFVYQVPLKDFKAEKLFNEIESNKQQLQIADWGISQCSLEDVFTRICELS